jgi:hypothetical protein
MKDHEIAELVNTLWSISKDYGHTGSLRQRISNVIVPAIRKAQCDALLEAADKCVKDAWTGDYKYNCQHASELRKMAGETE